MLSAIIPLPLARLESPALRLIKLTEHGWQVHRLRSGGEARKEGDGILIGFKNAVTR
jgi:hypothetical protein